MQRPLSETVAVLGATDNPHRFAYQCMRALALHGHKVLPVNPGYTRIEDMPCYPDLAACPGPIDTVTVYVRPSILAGMLEQIADVLPSRVILNPGTEEINAIHYLQAAGIEVQRACTLVLLSTNQYSGAG